MIFRTPQEVLVDPLDVGLVGLGDVFLQVYDVDFLDGRPYFQSLQQRATALLDQVII